MARPRPQRPFVPRASTTVHPSQEHRPAEFACSILSTVPSPPSARLPESCKGQGKEKSKQEGRGEAGEGGRWLGCSPAVSPGCGVGRGGWCAGDQPGLLIHFSSARGYRPDRPKMYTRQKEGVLRRGAPLKMKGTGNRRPLLCLWLLILPTTHRAKLSRRPVPE